jgi:hypothetical protein
MEAYINLYKGELKNNFDNGIELCPVVHGSPLLIIMIHDYRPYNHDYLPAMLVLLIMIFYSLVYVFLYGVLYFEC